MRARRRSLGSSRTIVGVAALAAFVVGAFWVSPIRAERSLSFNAMLQTDLRLRLQDVRAGEGYQRPNAEAGIARNDNLMRFKLQGSTGRFSGIVELDFAYYGYALKLEGFEDIYRREVVDAFRVEARAAYIEVRDLFVDGFELRIGQQTVAWGVGDQFNPTNVINALDLEDSIAFGEQLSNVMMRADYSSPGGLTLSAVMVPIFRPALLPRTAALGLAQVERMPFADAQLRWRSLTESWFVEKLGFPTVVSQADIILPESNLQNIQWAARIAGTVFDQDISLMAYRGRSDIPQAYANVTTADAGVSCDPVATGGGCINGLLKSRVALMYPAFWMLGFNAAGELPNPLALLFKRARAIGYRIEVGVFFPQRVEMLLVNKDLDLGAGLSMASGQYPSPGITPEVVSDTPFAKWVLGLDYTFSQRLYVNAMWIHGFPDEFGAGDFITEGYTLRHAEFDKVTNASGPCSSAVLGQNLQGQDGDFSRCVRELYRPRIGDYIAAGMDWKFLDEKGLLRLFFILDLTGVYEEAYDVTARRRVKTHHGLFSSKGFSAVIFPELRYDFGGGFELAAGALIKLGKHYSKFGEAAAGGHLLWTRARWSY